eukprot:Nitzschia sp. Nitz4//scaffold161_size51353//1729//2092//NITZ4_006938-RA/size51353-snap-gene-0.8-mRNA-1//-1//CDS//3329537879//5452//frame0
MKLRQPQVQTSWDYLWSFVRSNNCAYQASSHGGNRDDNQQRVSSMQFSVLLERWKGGKVELDPP